MNVRAMKGEQNDLNIIYLCHVWYISSCVTRTEVTELRNTKQSSCLCQRKQDHFFFIFGILWYGQISCPHIKFGARNSRFQFATWHILSSAWEKTTQVRKPFPLLFWVDMIYVQEPMTCFILSPLCENWYQHFKSSQANIALKYLKIKTIIK
jgi:hypothetical protein